MDKPISRNEILSILKGYSISKDPKLSNDNEFNNVLKHIENCIGFEKPDAYFVTDLFIYGIEHFQVSLHPKKKNNDIARCVSSIKDNRDKLKNEQSFDLTPKIENLISEIERLLLTHSSSFSDYKTNVIAANSDIDELKPYRLIIFIEDTSNPAYIVKKKSSDTRPINPLLLKQIAQTLLKYKNDIFGVIYSYGDEKSKILSGCTLYELEKSLVSEIMLDATGYMPFEYKKTAKVGLSPESDETSSIIKLTDHF